MTLYPIDQENIDSFYPLFSELRKQFDRFEYRSGFFQRLKDGFGIIHTPRRTLPYGNSNAELLLSLFSDNKTFTLNEVETVIGKKLTSELLSVGFFYLNEEKNSITSTFRIIPINQFLILIPFRQFNNPPVYIGADSLTFARHIQFPQQPKKVLDLATGSGFQLFSLPWHGGTTEMKGLDVNPNAIQTGIINSHVNHTSWIQFKEKDIETDLSSLGEKFDLIIGNPPIIPTPDSKLIKTRLGGMIHADGGNDGFSVVRNILIQIPFIMTESGSLQLILCSLGTENSLNITLELEQILSANELFGQLVIIKKIPVELDAYYRGQRDLHEYNRWMKFYREEKVSYWYRLILRVSKNNISQKKEHLTILQLIRNDFSKCPNPERITLNNIKSKIAFYLADTLVQNESFIKISEYCNKIEKLIESENWKTQSIRDFGIVLFEKMRDLFPTEGAAIRFWGQCTNEFWWKPKYLERVLW